jgi:3-oxoacyl-(acyl-carrier-protein) synthase
MMSGGPLAGLHALGRGAAAIRNGRSRIALVGPVETLSRFSLDFARLLYAGHIGLPAFFGRGGGLAPAEGGCMLVLERRDEALARGARILARIGPIAGGHANDEMALQDALSRLLRRAGVTLDEVGLASTGQSGGGLPQDHAEQALWRSLGTQCPPLAAARSLSGEAESMSAVAQVALAGQALYDREIPPVHNAADEAELPVCRSRAPLAGACALVSALDVNGSYAFLLLSREACA